VSATPDPLGGSYFVEALTDTLEERAGEYLEKIDGMGGAVAAIEAGFYQDEIGDAAYRIQKGIESGARVVVGVNRFRDDAGPDPEIQLIGEEEVAGQIARLRALRRSRDASAVERTLAEIDSAARGSGNVLFPMREALRVRATLGDVSDVLRGVFGEYRPSR
jgi:methylmalonyl-CoA mutase N-terminal domain/subunit